MVRYTLTVLVVLLAGQSVAAGAVETPIQFLQSDHAGTIHLEGPALLVLKRGEHELPGHELMVEAGSMRAELDRVSEAPHVAGASLNQELPGEKRNFESATLTVGPNAEDAYMALVALHGSSAPSVSAFSSCATFRAADGNVEVDQFVHVNREPIKVDASHSVNATLCPGTLTARGDFLLVLWEWSGSIVARGGEPWNFTTGREYQEYVEVPQVGRPVAYQGSRAQAYIILEDATVRYTASGTPATIIGGDLMARTDGSALMRGAVLVSDLGVGKPSTIELEGSIAGPVSSTAAGRLLQSVEGELVFTGDKAVVRVAPPPSAPVLLPWVVVGVLSVLSVLLVPSAQWWVERARRFLDAGWPRLCVVVATWAAWRDRANASPFMQRAVARTSIGRFEPARRDLDRAWTLVSSPRNRARVALEVARVLGHMDRTEESLEWLRRVNELDASLLEEVDGDAPWGPGAAGVGSDGWMAP